jgi:hypothetical protein
VGSIPTFGISSQVAAPGFLRGETEMPGLGGPETASRISDGHPDTSVVFVSADPGLARLVEPAPFLAKSELSPRELRGAWKAIRAEAAAVRGQAHQLRRQAQGLSEEAQALSAQAEQQAKRSKRNR